MALVYTKRLVGPVLNSAASVWATVGTTPAGKVWVLRNILVINSGADTTKAWLAINGTATVNRVFLLNAATTEAAHLETRIVLTAGETLRYRTTVTTLQGTTLTVMGYEFDA